MQIEEKVAQVVNADRWADNWSGGGCDMVSQTELLRIPAEICYSLYCLS